MSIQRHKFTEVVHAGAEIDKRTGAIMVPIYQTSTYVQKEPGIHNGWDYSRAGNPSRDSLELALAKLEGVPYGLAFSSGLAAEQAILQTLNPLDEIIVCDDVYGGTGRLFRTLFAKFGLKFSFVDMTQIGAVKQSITEKTKLFWIETPTNPLLKVIDIEKIVSLAKECGAQVVVDNTFSSPIFQSPISLGADIVVHSSTKYIGGHSDIIGGAVMTKNEQLFEKLKYVQFAAGAVPGPFECFLLHRSIKTLAIRMQQHQINAQKIAEFLEQHPKIESVFYPGLESHPQHALALKQMTGFSGIVSFNLKGTYETVKSFLKNLKIFALAESLGGVESLVNHPEKMTHASVPADQRTYLGIGPNLLRLSIGIEDAEELILDLQQALGRIEI